MGFFSKLFGGGGRPGEQTDSGGFHFYVRCNKCGEVLHIRANPSTDISDEYDGEQVTKVLHKEVLGSRCQNLMYVHLTLDSGLRITESETDRCTLMDKETYEAALIAAPDQG